MSANRIILSLFLIFLSAFELAAQEQHIFESKDMKAVISLKNGAIVSLENKNTGWCVIPENSRMNFVMNILDENGHGRWIDGMKQSAPECTATADSLTFRWTGLVPDGTNEKLDVEFVATVKFSPQTGLVFAGKLRNLSNCEIETLAWPVIAGLSVPERTSPMKFCTITYSRMNVTEIYPDLNFTRANCNLPEQAFALIGNDKEGLYASSLDRDVTQYIQYQCASYTTDKYRENLGKADAKTRDASYDSGLLYDARANRRLYLQPDSNIVLVPFQVKTYTGTWHKGADIYKEWERTWYKAPRRPEWVTEVNSWQQLQINSSESRINFKIKDLVQYAKECKKFGVAAIQLTGWNWGGQDRGVPYHTIDPRLGTMDEFRNVIAECAKFGVKILPFTKFTWSDFQGPASDDYKDKIVQRRDGSMAIHGGYSYNTATQLMVMNNRRFGILCFDDPVCRKQICDEFKKVLDLGAAGMVYDENQHHAGAFQCFNPNHGHAVPGFNYGGADKLGKEFYELTQKYSPDFMMVGEAPWDLQSKYYATYTREFPDHVAAMRYLHSDLPMSCAVIDHNDLNRVSMCLRCRYIISYEPRNFKGHLGEYPRVMEYGRQVDDLRRRYSDYVWDAEFRDTQGAVTTGNRILHAVFVRPDGKRAVVICNTDAFNSSVATMKLDGSPTGKLYVVTPAKPNPVLFTGFVQIEPQGAVVVIEE